MVIRLRPSLACALVLGVFTGGGLGGAAAEAGERAFVVGADVSMLSEIEKAGGAFRGDDGSPGDAIRILRDNGCDLFRLRVFVDPDKDFASTWGATQDLPAVRELAKRVKG